MVPIANMNEIEMAAPGDQSDPHFYTIDPIFRITLVSLSQLELRSMNIEVALR